MRRITMALLSTVAALVLLFSYRTSTAGPGAPVTAVAGAAPAGVVPAVTPGTATPGTVAPGTAAQRDVTVNGAVVQTRWGPVQVQVKIAAGRIADVVVLLYPQGERRDVEINSFALPQLREQALAAQSAHLDGVSGATVTTGGYVGSLQSALDAARFGS